MYGLAVIFLFSFSLILWIVLTRLAVKFGRKIFTRMLPQYGWAGKAGAFAGFMLLMGGWIVKWEIENWQAVRHAEEACKKTGVWVYVDPEEWKRMVGGEEAWRELGYYPYAGTSEEVGTCYPETVYPETVNFEGIEYQFSGRENARVAWYTNFKLSNKPYVSLWSEIYYDAVSKRVLYKATTSYLQQPSIEEGFKGFFWSGEKDCRSIYKLKQREVFHQFIYLPTNRKGS